MIDTELPYFSHIDGFADEDVQVNEAGSLSETQRSVLRRRLVMSMLGVAIGIGITVWIIASGGFNLVAFFCIIGISYAAYQCLSSFLWLRDPTVSVVEGDAWVEVRSNDDSTEYVLHINDLKLKTDKEVEEALVSGGPYRAFYIDEMDQLVAIRPLGGWRAVPRPEPARRFHLPFNISIG